jgi:hypothetical protein
MFVSFLAQFASSAEEHYVQVTRKQNKEGGAQSTHYWHIIVIIYDPFDSPRHLCRALL